MASDPEIDLAPCDLLARRPVGDESGCVVALVALLLMSGFAFVGVFVTVAWVLSHFPIFRGW